MMTILLDGISSFQLNYKRNFRAVGVTASVTDVQQIRSLSSSRCVYRLKARRRLPCYTGVRVTHAAARMITHTIHLFVDPARSLSLSLSVTEDSSMSIRTSHVVV